MLEFLYPAFADAKYIPTDLECCTNPNGNDCYQCPKNVAKYDTTTEYSVSLMEDVLDLINRQKAEIEALKKHVCVEPCCAKCEHLLKTSGAFTHQCAQGIRNFLPFGWEDDITTYACKCFKPIGAKEMEGDKND